MEGVDGNDVVPVKDILGNAVLVPKLKLIFSKFLGFDGHLCLCRFKSIMNRGYSTGPSNGTLVLFDESVNFLLILLEIQIKFAIDNLQDPKKFRPVFTAQGKDFTDHKETISTVLRIPEIFEFVDPRLVVEVHIAGGSIVLVEWTAEGFANLGKSASQKVFKYIQAFIGRL
jgi:hypothetical protein